MALTHIIPLHVKSKVTSLANRLANEEVLMNNQDLDMKQTP
jgi:hypothetical protein